MEILKNSPIANGVDYRNCVCDHCVDDFRRDAARVETPIIHCVFCGSFYRLAMIDEIGFCKVCHDYKGLVESMILI